MFFSEYFNVEASLLNEYGAVDISLICDVPLFVDPMLIFNSDKEEYKILHQEIIRYFHFLHEKSNQGLSNKEIDAWFNFSEVPNNWLGYSMVGNKGLALGKKYARFLYNNIGFVLKTNGISKGQHIEKAMLLYEGSGKDKISDLTVNLIKKHLCEYTEKFARQYMDSKFCKTLPVEKAFFNYETESFVSKEYYLPFITNSKGCSEYVLLSPFDILREEEPSINRRDFFLNHERIRASIDNDTLRTFVNNYIRQAILNYDNDRKALSDNKIQKIEMNAFKEIVNDFPELYDYFIKLQENSKEDIKDKCIQELNEQITRLITASKSIVQVAENIGYTINENISAREEAKNRLRFFKHIIEDCDGYKNLYVNGQQIAKENDLQRLFRYVWYGTNYKVDSETNNGRGQTDFIVSMGSNNQNIVEFKLASNSSLNHVFTQVEIYEAANSSKGSLIAIFYFSEKEFNTAKSVVESFGYIDKLDEAIYLIDCRNDNKKSASIA